MNEQLIHNLILRLGLVNTLYLYTHVFVLTPMSTIYCIARAHMPTISCWQWRGRSGVVAIVTKQAQQNTACEDNTPCEGRRALASVEWSPRWIFRCGGDRVKKMEAGTRQRRSAQMAFMRSDFRGPLRLRGPLRGLGSTGYRL